MHRLRTFLGNGCNKMKETDNRLLKHAAIVVSKPLLYLIEANHLNQHLDLALLRQDLNAKILSVMAHPVDELGQLLKEFAPMTSDSPMSKMQQAALKRHRIYTPKPFKFNRNPFPQEMDQGNIVIPNNSSPISPMLKIEEVMLAPHSTHMPKLFRANKYTLFQTILQDYMTIFDNFYFFGSLKNYVRLIFRDLNPHGHGNLHGRAKDRMLSCPKYITIKMDWKCHGGSSFAHDDWELELQRMLGTLLHEMIHAFLVLFQCHCNLPACQTSRSKMEGRSYHGAPWQHAAFAIEESARALLGFPDIELSRESCFVEEFCATTDIYIQNGLGPWFAWSLDDEPWKMKMDEEWIRHLMEDKGWVWNGRGDRIRKTSKCQNRGCGCILHGPEENDSKGSISEESRLPLMTEPENPLEVGVGKR